MTNSLDQSQYAKLLMQQQGKTAMGYMRERWTEDEVLELPEGEHDYFDRKAGMLLEKKDEWQKKLSKALSAFANSGGGHIILGQHDDGTIDGVDPNHGRTPVTDWLEQVIPNLVTYPLKTFRVHRVVPRDDESKIPLGKVIVVVDVGDSPLAPHQAAIPSDAPVYYYRSGSQSKPAPHHYLEALRTRFVGAQLTATYEGIRDIKFSKGENQTQRRDYEFAEVVLGIKIENVSRQACYKWVLDWKLNERPQQRPILEPTEFDSSYPSLLETQDEVILPSRQIEKMVSIGVPLAPADHMQGIFLPLIDTRIQYRAISEHYVPEFIGGPIAGHADRWMLGDQFRLNLEKFLAGAR